MMAPNSEIGQFSNLIFDEFSVSAQQENNFTFVSLFYSSVKKPFMKFITHSASYAFFLSECENVSFLIQFY